MSDKLNSEMPIEDIELENVIRHIKTEFPKIKFDEFNSGIPYVEIDDFNKYLKMKIDENDEKEIERISQYIENLHFSPSKKIREFATIGILEGIQNTFEDEKLKEYIFDKILKSESKKWWNQLKKFWKKNILNCRDNTN